MKSLSFDTLVNAGSNKLETLAASVQDAKVSIVLGKLLTILGEKMINNGKKHIVENFSIGHVNVVCVAGYEKSEPDFSKDEGHKKLLEKLNAYEKKNADKVPQKITVVKPTLRINVTKG